MSSLCHASECGLKPTSQSISLSAMNTAQQRNETCEHLLATGEALCLQRGFTGMGLNELLSIAQVPKGSFYYYFRSKEAFGVALLERYFVQYIAQIEQQLSGDEVPAAQRILNHFATAEALFRQKGHIVGCLGVKLSAEVCDLSEPMRDALQRGAEGVMRAYARTLKQAQLQGANWHLSAEEMAQMLYVFWSGASLQSKISRDPQPLSLALKTFGQWLDQH